MHPYIQLGDWKQSSLAGKELHDLVKSKLNHDGGNEVQPHTGLH